MARVAVKQGSATKEVVKVAYKWQCKYCNEPITLLEFSTGGGQFVDKDNHTIVRCPGCNTYIMFDGLTEREESSERNSMPVLQERQRTKTRKSSKEKVPVSKRKSSRRKT